MLESFTIDNYRSFKNFKLSKLGRVNLFVGENNSGKTSILEAIYLYYSYPNLTSLLEILNYRGEFSWIEDDSFLNGSIDSPLKRMRKDFNIASIFNEYKFDCDINFTLTSLINNDEYQLQVSIKDESIDNLENAQMTFENLSKSYQKFVYFDFTKKNQEDLHDSIKIEISDEGNFLVDSVKKNLRKRRLSDKKAQLITLSEDDIDDLIEIFDDISLTPKEDIIIEAVRIIEPRIKRIATTKSERGEKGSFKILLTDYDKPISIGTMGDGIWRLLSIALAMINTQDGVLLIDEIDTGLHFTTLLKMWELILETSKKLNVQVFATTHNSDCWMALGELISKKNTEENGNKLLENEVTLHRIESDKNKSVLFTAEQIAIAANREIEVR